MYSLTGNKIKKFADYTPGGEKKPIDWNAFINKDTLVVTKDYRATKAQRHIDRRGFVLLFFGKYST
jgi:hypothetical protein